MALIRKLPPDRPGETCWWEARVRTPAGWRSKVDEVRGVVERWADELEEAVYLGDFDTSREA